MVTVGEVAGRLDHHRVTKLTMAECSVKRGHTDRYADDGRMRTVEGVDRESIKGCEEGRKDRNPSSEKMTMAEISQSLRAWPDQEPTC
jgi:hypothetical protein